MDVADVPRGKKCGCICPSCKTPLVARHGDVKEWHFAHISRSVYAKTKKECEFSFYVSARMMARQIIGQRLEIIVPEYKDCLVGYEPLYDANISVPFTVAERQKLTLIEVEVEQNFLGVPVDVYGHVGQFSFIIYFTHPGRDVPIEFRDPGTSKCGIISVSLTELPRLFRQARSSNNSYHAVLHEFLVNDIASKKWVFHPRHKRGEEKAKRELEQKRSQTKRPHGFGRKIEPESYLFSSELPREKPISDTPIEHTPKRLAKFECVLCHTIWQGWEPSGSVCPKCKTHLYRTLVGYVDD